MKKGTVRYKHWQQEGFPLWLQQQMDSRGWNASELARQIDVVPSLISRWMSGRQKPSIESLAAIADVFGFPREMVYREAGHLHPVEQGGRDPRRDELMARLYAIDLTHERYLAISALFSAMATQNRQSAQ